MVYILSKILLYFFASYGALLLLMTIIDSIRQRAQVENKMVKMVLLIKDQEETIEGVVRNIYVGSFLRKILSGNRMAIIDMGSEDKTMEILVRLRKDYDYFDVLDQNEKEEVFRDFNLEKY